MSALPIATQEQYSITFHFHLLASFNCSFLPEPCQPTHTCEGGGSCVVVVFTLPRCVSFLSQCIGKIGMSSC